MAAHPSRHLFSLTNLKHPQGATKSLLISGSPCSQPCVNPSGGSTLMASHNQSTSCIMVSFHWTTIWSFHISIQAWQPYARNGTRRDTCPKVPSSERCGNPHPVAIHFPPARFGGFRWNTDGMFADHTSGQIIIFHQARFPWNTGISLTKPPFGVGSCEVTIIWPDIHI